MDKKDKSVPLRISTFLDNEAINRYLDSIPKIPSAPVKIALYAFDERYNFEEIFKEWCPTEYTAVSLNRTAETDKYILFTFEMILPDKFKKKCPGCEHEFFASDFEERKNKDVIYLLQLKGLPFAIVISNSHFQESDYTFSFFDSYYPFMTRIFVRAHQLVKILRDIEQKKLFGENVYSSEFILKKYFIEKVTERHYKKRDFESIFVEAEKSGLWLDNITFRVEEKGRLQLSRDGKVQYYDSFVFSDILIVIDMILSNYLESYELIKSIKQKRQEGEFKAIKIILDEALHTDTSNSNPLIPYLEGYPQASLTILSQNGPFFEATVIDYSTGSSFDICVYDSKTISIIPQFQATTVSLIKVVNYLLEEYDGKIE